VYDGKMTSRGVGKLEMLAKLRTAANNR
jgi:hypothetical protein